MDHALPAPVPVPEVAGAKPTGEKRGQSPMKRNSNDRIGERAK
jgi:hypothetical protein